MQIDWVTQAERCDQRTGIHVILVFLDGSCKLSPTSEKGWNFYHECNKEEKKEVAPSGLRKDREVLLDRDHPESLLPAIPLYNVIFDIIVVGPGGTGLGWRNTIPRRAPVQQDARLEDGYGLCVGQ